MANIVEIKNIIVQILKDSQRKQTQPAIEKQIAHQLNIKRKTVKNVLNNMINSGEIEYINKFGCSFIDISYGRPVRISDHVVVKPQNIFFQPITGDVVVNIEKGISFGTGRHPTTCLSVRAIEWVMYKEKYFQKEALINALDVGTGSGILAITALKFGVHSAVGIDIDPCARHEALKNIKLNGLYEKIDICGKEIESFTNKFSMITANLRYPTIKGIFSSIHSISRKGSIVIFSGIKTDEISGVLSLYTEKYFNCIWRDSEKGWAGLVLEKL